MRVAWAAVVCAVAVATACSGGTTHGAGPGVASPTAPSRATRSAPASGPASTLRPASPTSKAPPTEQPTTTTEALLPQQSPDVAARSLFDAWTKGDRPGALHVATPAAVAALFARPVATYSDRGCQDPISDRALCAFGVGDGLAQVGTVSLAGGWVVETLTFE